MSKLRLVSDPLPWAPVLPRTIEKAIKDASVDAVEYTRSTCEARIGMTAEEKRVLYDQIFLLLCSLRLARIGYRRDRWLDDPEIEAPTHLVRGESHLAWIREFSGLNVACLKGSI